MEECPRWRPTGSNTQLGGSWLSLLFGNLMLRWEKVDHMFDIWSSEVVSILCCTSYSKGALIFYCLAAELDPHDGKRKCETLWPIFKISHQKSRYIFDLYHKRTDISKELYEFCLDQGYADRNLIAKWKKVCFSSSIWKT